MRRSEIHATIERFKSIHQRLTRSALGGQDDDYAAVKNELDVLLPVITQNYELFNAEERDFISAAKLLYLTPRYRVGFARERTRSESSASSQTQ